MSDRPRNHRPLDRPHVVVVSDDADLQDFLGEGLVYAGLWTSGIASAIQTLEVFRLRTFDAMVVDAALGGLGAVELVRRLRGASPLAAPGQPLTDLPILAVAADRAEADVEALAAAGVEDVLFAPLELENVASRCRVLVEAWREAHPGRPSADELAQQPPEPAP